MFRRHVGLIEKLKHGPRTLHEVRKACAWYARGLFGCNALRLRVWETPDVAAARVLVEDYFTQLIERQRPLHHHSAQFAYPDVFAGQELLRRRCAYAHAEYRGAVAQA